MDTLHDIDYPDLIFQERVFLDGYLYDVYLEDVPGAGLQLTIHPVYYTCWDGSIPF